MPYYGLRPSRAAHAVKAHPQHEQPLGVYNILFCCVYPRILVILCADRRHTDSTVPASSIELAQLLVFFHPGIYTLYWSETQNEAAMQGLQPRAGGFYSLVPLGESLPFMRVFIILEGLGAQIT